MAETATYIILTAGGMTFVNEWYQTGTVNWRVPVATMLAAAVFDGLSKIDDKAATALAVMALLVAATTKFGGKSVSETVADIFKSTTTKQTTVTASRKAA